MHLQADQSGPASRRAGLRRRRWLLPAATAILTALSGGIVVATSTTEAAAATIDTSAWYVLVNRNSGKALDVYNLATADGARITQWTRNDGNQQQWQFVDSGGGYYRLEVPPLRQGPGRLQLVHRQRRRDRAVGRPQRHQPAVAARRHRGGYVRLINRNSGKALEVQGASTADGANIVQYDDWGGTNQQWQLVQVGGGTTPPPTTTRRGWHVHSSVVVPLDLDGSAGATRSRAGSR